MQLSDKIAASENVVAREVSNETVLLNLESGTYFGLNEVGGKVWALLEKAPSSLSAVCEAIVAEFEAPAAQIEKDVLQLAGELLENGLITTAN